MLIVAGLATAIGLAGAAISIVAQRKLWRSTHPSTWRWVPACACPVFMPDMAPAGVAERRGTLCIRERWSVV